MISDTVLSNDYNLAQQKHHHRSNGNTPSDPSDQESDDDNFDTEIYINSYHSLAKVYRINQFLNKNF